MGRVTMVIHSVYPAPDVAPDVAPDPIAGAGSGAGWCHMGAGLKPHVAPAEIAVNSKNSHRVPHWTGCEKPLHDARGATRAVSKSKHPKSATTVTMRRIALHPAPAPTYPQADRHGH